MRSDILTGDVGDELSVAVLLAVQDQGSLVALVLHPESLAAEEKAKLQWHIELKRGSPVTVSSVTVERIACDSSTGFALPNGARRSPDAAWTLKSRVAQLDAASREKYWHLCPDFVVELQSSTDRPRILKDKMREWLANGAQLGWLIDPEHRSVAIYRPEGQAETHTGIESIPGEGPVAGFVLDLSFVWNPLGV